jgi:hypothetical protein
MVNPDPIPTPARRGWEPVDRSRYEQIMLGGSRAPDGPPGAFAAASRAARARCPAASPREAVIRDVAAGVAGPALVCYVLWVLRQARERGLERLRFLSRDGQVLHLIAERIAERTGTALDLEYVHSSRITWSLAASDPDRLAGHDWLFSSFMTSNAADLCARLGLDPADFRGALADSGVSPDPRVRADSPAQRAAMERFLGRPDVAAAAAARVGRARELLADYAVQHRLAERSTGLVDAGWTGRMVGSLVKVAEAAGLAGPHVFFWGHEPRADGWTDPERVHAYVYDTARGEGLGWRVPDAPFVVESFCMADHGIVGGYRRGSDGRVCAVLRSGRNAEAQAWGLGVHRAGVLGFADALDLDAAGGTDARPLVHALMDAFWVRPTRAEARAWGGYVYDSDPTGTAARRLARPFTVRDLAAGAVAGRLPRGDRAWLRGSLALGSRPVRLAARRLAARDDLAGAPPPAPAGPAAGPG